MALTRQARRRRGGAAAEDPLRLLGRWLNQARRAAVPLAEAMALATTDGRGQPSVRFMLMKNVDARGLVFYTNVASRKGRELRHNPRAAAAFYWHASGKQVRVEGRVEAVAAAEADAYWATRPRASQIGALASAQSAPLRRRADLLARWRRLERAYRGRPVPRPRGWTGYRLVADVVELWIRHEPRLHHRVRYTRTRRGWTRRLLQP
jgi:pyridoxamine 5'-phosphate oxidase